MHKRQTSEIHICILHYRVICVINMILSVLLINMCYLSENDTDWKPKLGQTIMYFTFFAKFWRLVNLYCLLILHHGLSSTPNQLSVWKEVFDKCWNFCDLWFPRRETDVRGIEFLVSLCDLWQYQTVSHWLRLWPDIWYDHMPKKDERTRWTEGKYRKSIVMYSDSIWLQERPLHKDETYS